MTTTTTVISRPNPYVGPRPYRAGETIYGRERETSELLDILISERIVLLYSASGAGKSSLLNAAILPKMAEQGFQVYPVIRVNMEPPINTKLGNNFNRYIYSCILSIEEGLPEEQRFSIEELAQYKFKEYLAKYHERAHSLNQGQNSDAPILLIFDQAEEVVRISMTDRPQKQDFFVQLGEVLRDKSIWALIAMREDYLASFDPYLRPIPTRLANRYRLTFLDAEAAIKAIQLPAKNAGVEITNESAIQLVDDLRAILTQQQDGSAVQELGPIIEPVQLQVVCRRLWSNLSPGETTVSPEHIKSVGSVDRALADYYALQTASVANMAHTPEREIREWFERKLITSSGIRGQVLLTPERSDGLDNKTIWMLERAYLIRAEKRGGATWFELAHDRFVRPIRENNAEWVDKHLNSFQRRADLWNLQGRPDSLLQVGKEFPAMENWVKTNAKIITPIEKDFYQDSSKAHENAIRERHTEIAIRWLLVGSVISTLVAIVFFFRSHIAEQSAMARGLAAASLGNLQSNPELSILLAIEGWDVTTQPNPEIIQALHRALPKVRMLRSSLQSQNGHDHEIYNIVYSPDGKFLASASQDGTIKIWDANNLSVLKTIELVKSPHSDGYDGATDVTYSPNGNLLAAVDSDGKLSVLNTANWSVKYQIAAHKGKINAIAYSNNSKYIATGGDDSIAKIWDAETGKKVYEFGDGIQGNKSGIQALIFSTDSATLFTGGNSDPVIYAWDLATGKVSYKFSNTGSRNAINSLAISPDGTRLSSSGTDHLIRMWNVSTKSWMMDIPGHADWVYGMAFTTDGKKLISASADRTIHIWDVAYGRSEMILTGSDDQVYAVATSPDGRYLVSTGADHLIRLWDISVQGSREILTLDHRDEIRAIEFNPNGKTIASAGRGGVINLWDAVSGLRTGQLNITGRSAEALFWSRDGRYLAAGYASGQAIIWDVNKQEPKLTIQVNNKAVTGIALNNNYSRMITGSDDAIVRVYNTVSGQEVNSFDANKQLNWGITKLDEVWINCVVVSHNNKYVAASYSRGPTAGKGVIVIWDLESGKAVTTLNGHTNIVENITYNHDDSLLASASDDGNVILWDTNPTNPNPLKTTLTGHIALVYDVAFSPDGKFLVSGGGDNVLKVWDVDNEGVVVELYGNTKSIRAVAFSPDGQSIISGSEDHTVRFFTFNNNQKLLELAHDRVTRQLTDLECNKYLNNGLENEITCQDFKNSDWIKPITDIFNNMFLHK